MFVNKIIEKIKPAKIYIEIFLLLIFAYGLLVINSNAEISNFLFTISLIPLSILYFLIGIATIEGGWQVNFSNKIHYWAISLTLIGILFKNFLYSNTNNMRNSNNC